MKNYIITQLLTSKKVWLGIASIVIPMVANYLNVDEASVSQIWWSLIAMLGGQAAADWGKSKKQLKNKYLEYQDEILHLFENGVGFAEIARHLIDNHRLQVAPDYLRKQVGEIVRYLISDKEIVA